MSALNYNFFKQELKRFETSNICNLCCKQFVNPVRIRICGHYFCEECLDIDRDNEQCPKCKEHYENNEVDYQNAARKVQKYLDELKMLFSSEDEDDHDKNSQHSNTFVCNNRLYHIQFCDELFRKVNVKGESPLHIACKKRKIEDVLNLLKKDTDINIQDFAGWTPLHEAVESESYEIVEALLNHGALIDVMGEDYTTPLHKAAILRNKKIIKLLLEYGASKDFVDFFGKKPIDYINDENFQRIFDVNFESAGRIQKLFLSKKITAFCYYIEDEYKNKLKSLKNAKIENDYDPKKVTHFFIRKTHKISVKIFLAMLNGCLIVPQEYIDNVINDNYYIDFPNYTYINNVKLNRGIQKAMLNSLLKMPLLFDGIRFFIHGHKKRIPVNEIKISKDELSSLIIAGGGKILPRAPTPTTCKDFRSFPYHSTQGNSGDRCCHYIIYEEKDPPAPLYQMPDLKHKSSAWLIDCIINFSIGN